MQSTITKYNFTNTSWLSKKRLTSIGKDMKKLEACTLVVATEKGAAAVENSLMGAQTHHRI